MTSKNSISYHQVGDYLIPNLIISPEEAVRLGKWGMLHKDYMLRNKKVTVTIMTAEGRFWRYLAEVDKQATDMFAPIAEQVCRTPVLRKSISPLLTRYE